MLAASSRSHIARAGRLGSGPALGPQNSRRETDKCENAMSTTTHAPATVEVPAQDCNDNGTVFCPN
ncbi:hypothetical protein Q6332_28765, partial [Klebsiella pneumoniae]|uniref:hypothetical protein n=1 Tax=Klebsiella pneumoniae TaxID=573 RepID=UPI002731094D